MSWSTIACEYSSKVGYKYSSASIVGVVEYQEEVDDHTSCKEISKSENEAKMLGKLHKRQQQQHQDQEEVTKDGSIDIKGRPALRYHSGGWKSATLLLVNQGLATLAFFGVAVNLVVFLTRVLQQSNADAANNVSKWTGTVYLFSLVGAFLSDAYWGRYKTCAIFQLIFVLGLSLLSLSSYLSLVKPGGCGDGEIPCNPPSSMMVAAFYLSIYLIALGNGGYQPLIATFGSDQFDANDQVEGHSKVAFYSYFYLALNLGSLFSNTILVYFEDDGKWVIGFLTSSLSAFSALVLFLLGTFRYRHLTPSGSPLSRLFQVFVAAFRKRKVVVPSDKDMLYEVEGKSSAGSSRKMMHSFNFRCLDKAATITPSDLKIANINEINPWRLCTITQVEEVKRVLRILPIWLFTIMYSVVFTQMASLFVVQGTVMNTHIGEFHIPAASMSAFDVLSVTIFTFIYLRIVIPISTKLTKNPKGLTELQRMGIGIVLGILAMIAAGLVELYRLNSLNPKSLSSSSSPMNIFWQIPQYMLIGASEVFMYVGQLEFFNSQTPDSLKSFGSALCMTSISFGNYVSSILVTIVMAITTKDNNPGWIPVDLNRGHLDYFFFLLAGLTGLDLICFISCAKCYKYIKLDSVDCSNEEEEDEFKDGQVV